MREKSMLSLLFLACCIYGISRHLAPWIQQAMKQQRKQTVDFLSKVRDDFGQRSATTFDFEPPWGFLPLAAGYPWLTTAAHGSLRWAPSMVRADSAGSTVQRWLPSAVGGSDGAAWQPSLTLAGVAAMGRFHR